MAPLPENAPVGVYVHVPFCSRICPYCDFNTYAGMDSLIPRYLDALHAEIARFPAQSGKLQASTIFLGGGTPSLLTAEQIGGIIDTIARSFSLTLDVEVTLEANPNSVDEPYFAGLLDAGVNRLSIGAQTFNRRGLRTLGRQHESGDVMTAIQAARNAGFANISCDLIFGWPGQSVDLWRQDVEMIAGEALGLTHLSLYSLIVEPGTPMAEAVGRGVLVPVSDDDAADLYEIACDYLGEAGWIHYEIANWAREKAFPSRHNMTYWRNGGYAGFGAGAHWRIGAHRHMNHLLPQTYIEAIERGESAVSNSEEITPRLAMGETMMLGLRLLDEGVTESEFSLRHGVSLQTQFGEELTLMSEIGLLHWDGHRARLTSRGMLLANDVCARFLS